MSSIPHVVVVVARCVASDVTFGMRFEEQGPGTWSSDWAFQLPPARATREGYDQAMIEGTIGLAASYPGCPGCGSPSVFQCSCGRMNCWDGQSKTATCSWCNASVNLSGQITSIRSGQDV